jgi:hypothetical protein
MSPTSRCPYCKVAARLVDGTVIYPSRPDLAHLSFYLCGDCDAYVGCHKGTTRPMGRLADKALRWAKQKAHADFDPLWKSGPMSRQQAYAWLASKMGMTARECHIGEFDVNQCGRVVQIMEKHRERI